MFSDLLIVSQWWIVLFFLGISAIPLTFFCFSNFFDKGYAFTKTITILIVSFVFFLLNIIKILSFSSLNLWVVAFLFVFLNIIIFRKNTTKITSWVRTSKRVIVFQEFLFLFGLLLWSYVRAHQPDINGLEKFMDYGFINSILRSKYLPPLDMWFSGKSINYYWFGHYLVAVITKLSNISSNFTYNLMLGTIMGISLNSAFSISASLTKEIGAKIKTRTIYIVGILSAILLVFGGNFHTPIYAAREGINNYWYPDATRFVGYNPETNDKTIHEFPIYSFVVSDLHAHLINLPNVLLYIALLLTFYLGADPKLRPTTLNKEQSKSYVLENPKSKKILLPLGILLGIMFMTSAWDYANYGLFSAITLGIYYLYMHSSIKKAIIPLTASLFILVSISLLTIIPFLASFKSIAEGIALVKSQTPLYQLVILWGFPFLLIILFIFSIKSKRAKMHDLFIVSLLTTSWILIFLPEIVFVKDIYIATHHRANTMFKLTYQAFVMSYLTSGYIIFRVISSTKNKINRSLFLIFFSLLITIILIYPPIAIKSYYSRLETYKSLDGEAWLLTKNPNQYNAILWFRENVSGQPTILEAPGDSYTEYNAISAYTGLPTVSGWFVHEWLWRGGSSFPQKRVSDIAKIYTSTSLQTTKNLIAKYEIEYIVVGTLERQKYPKLYEAKFSTIGKKDFMSKNVDIYHILPN